MLTAPHRHCVVNVPFSGKHGRTYVTDESQILYYVDRLAVLATSKNNRLRKSTWRRNPRAFQCRLNCRPRFRLWTIASRVISHPNHANVIVSDGKRDFAGRLDISTTSACVVFTPTIRDAQDSNLINDKRGNHLFRFIQLLRVTKPAKHIPRALNVRAARRYAQPRGYFAWSNIACASKLLVQIDIG